MSNPEKTEAPGVFFPPELLRASLVSFQRSIDGYLLDARLHEGGYRAVIFFDASEVFDNGDVINTAEVVQVENEQGYVIVTTAVAKRYVIVNYLLYLRDEVDGVEHTRILSLKNKGSGDFEGKV